MSRLLRMVLIAIGVIAVILAVMPSTRTAAAITPTTAQALHLKEHPEDLPKAKDYLFGWSSSPLVGYHSECTLTDEDGRKVTVGQCNRTEANLLSWSGLTLAIGIGLLWFASRLRPTGKTAS